MESRKPILYPKQVEVLKQLGSQLKLARLRRNLTASLVAERAKISRYTVFKIEQGDPSVAMGYYVAVLGAIGRLENDLLLVAKEDKLGRTIQDLNIHVRKRAKNAD